jgi:hypothetical protein
MQYTALGAEVNLASRVEGLNKRYGTQIIATEATEAVEAQVRDHFLFRPLDLVVPAGTSHVIPLFELVGALDAGDDDGASVLAVKRCCEWRQAIETYRNRQWGEAHDRFRHFAACCPRIERQPFMPSAAAAFSPSRRWTTGTAPSITTPNNPRPCSPDVTRNRVAKLTDCGKAVRGSDVGGLT